MFDFAPRFCYNYRGATSTDDFALPAPNGEGPQSRSSERRTQVLSGSAEHRVATVNKAEQEASYAHRSPVYRFVKGTLLPGLGRSAGCSHQSRAAFVDNPGRSDPLF